MTQNDKKDAKRCKTMQNDSKTMRCPPPPPKKMRADPSLHIIPSVFVLGSIHAPSSLRPSSNPYMLEVHKYSLKYKYIYKIWNKNNLILYFLV